MLDNELQEIALVFARSLTNEQYQVAYDLLSSQLRQSLSPAKLKEEYENMTEYIDSPLESVTVDALLSDWSNKKNSDLSQIYVGLNFEGESEAVIVTITEEVGKVLVSAIEWGRP